MIRAVAVCLVLLASVASAQAPAQCGPRQQVVSVLHGKYGEGRILSALAVNGMVVEVWANQGTGTWTATVTTPRGLSCLTASGTAFSLLLEVVPEGNPL